MTDAAALRGCPSHCSGQGARVETSHLLGLKSRSGESGETEATKVRRTDHWRGDSCSERALETRADPCKYSVEY